MKKIAVLAAFAVIASAGVAVAQAPGAQPGGRRGGPGRGGAAMMDQMLFKGITLSDAQKTQLQSMRDADRQKMEAERQQGGQRGGGDFQAIRQARQSGDTATANKLMAEQRQKMEARRDEQYAKIRNLLTADQQKQFDANVAAMKQYEAEHPMGMRGRRPRG